MNLYTDINAECCAWLGSRVEDGSLAPGDVPTTNGSTPGRQYSSTAQANDGRNSREKRTAGKQESRWRWHRRIGRRECAA